MPETSPRRWPLPAIIGAMILLAVVVGVALTIAQPPGRQAAVQPTVSPTSTAPPTTFGPATTAPASPPAGLTDGIYAVGTEVQAGVYTTTVPAGKPYGCYWARLRSFGQSDSIIDEDNLDPGETQRVTVRASDRGFKVSNGCTWHPVL